MSYNKSLSIILMIFLGFIITNCGYTILSTKSDVVGSSATHPEYTFGGQWTKIAGDKYGDGFSMVTIYLLFISQSDSSGSYGLGFDKNPNIFGNYFISNNELTLVNEFNIQKFDFEFNGEYLELRIISIKQLDEKRYPLTAAGKWRRIY